MANGVQNAEENTWTSQEGKPEGVVGGECSTYERNIKCKFTSINLKGRGDFEDLDVDGSILLKLNVKYRW
jgi:hypothetical protein